MTKFGGKGNTNGFKQNPQNINKNGRPKKGVALVNQELTEKGYEPVTKQDIEANYLHLMNLTREELTKIGNDEKQPMLVRILVKNMLSGKGFDIIEKMLDRAIGKPKQITEEIGNKQSLEINIENQQLLDSLILE